MKKTILIICVIQIIIFSFLFTYAFYIGLKESYDSESWPQTTGIIKKAKIEESISKKRNITSWCVRLSYEYQIQGKTYISTKIKNGTTSCETSKLAAENKLKTTPENSDTTVFYDPEKPENSILTKSRDGNIFSWILMIFGAFIFVSAIIILTALLVNKINLKKKNNYQ